MNYYLFQNCWESGENSKGIRRLSSDRPRLNVIFADNDEQSAHIERLNLVNEKGGQCLWLTEEA